MKKFIIALTVLSVVTSLGFAKGGFFGNRWVEVQTNVPMQVSNNFFSYKDLKKGQDFVIDFTEMAETLPAYGYETIESTQPDAGLKINIANVSVGVFAGTDLTSKVVIGKGLFDFLGKGCEVNEETKFSADVQTDMFATARVPVSVDVRRLKISIEPVLFVPMLNCSVEDAKAVVKNTDDGKLIVDCSALLNVYESEDYVTMFSSEDTVYSTAISSVLSNALNNGYCGFALAGSVGFRFSDWLMLNSNFQIPIVPGTLTYSNSVSASFSYETTVMDAINGSSDSAEYSYSIGETQRVTRKLNRPLKFNLGIEYRPFYNDIVVLSALGGIGVVHPFSSIAGDTHAYPEYSFVAALNLANFLKAQLSTSYLNQSFIHQFGLGINLRLIEIDSGISAQGVTFGGSFKGCGLGAYVSVSVGI